MKVVNLIFIIMLFGCIPPESNSPSADIYDIEIDKIIAIHPIINTKE